MNYSWDNMFVLASGEMTGTYVIAGTIIALIVFAVIFFGMRKSVAGLPSTPDPGHSEETPDPEHADNHAFREKKPAGTPGFVLPLPSEAPAFPGTNPQKAQTKAADPAPVPREAPQRDPVRPTEPAADSQKEPVTQVLTPEMLAQGAGANVACRSMLVFRSGARAGEAIQLESLPGGQCAIGRSEVPENQVVVRDDLKVSRVQHAILACDSAGQYTIRDNNSANKVFVNETYIESAPVPLNHGDKIRLGLTEFEFVREPAS